MVQKVHIAKYLWLTAILQIVWGLTPAASAHVLKYLPVESYSAIRYSISGLVFLSYSLWQYKSWRLKWSRLPQLALIGILAYGFGSLGTLYGITVGGVLNFSLASSLNTIITAGFAIWLLHEKPSPLISVSAVLSVIGGLLLFLGKYDLANMQIAAGSLLLIWGAYACDALGFVYSKKLSMHFRLTEYIAVLQLSAGIFLWSLAYGAGHMPVGIAAMPASGWLALGFVCIISCCICYFIMYWLLTKVDGHKLAFFDCFHSISAALVATIVLTEPLNAKMMIGGALLILAVVVVNIKTPGSLAITAGKKSKAKAA